MNLDLAKALGKIEKGAERRLQAKRAEFEKLQQELGERQKIVGHIEKKEEPGEEEAMEDTETGKIVPKTTTTTTMTMTTTTATASTSSSTVQVTAEVYAKPYTKSADLRGEYSSARWEKRETWEKQLKERQEKENTEKTARLQEIEEQREVVKQALLEEEEKKQHEIVKKLREKEAMRKRKEKE